MEVSIERNEQFACNYVPRMGEVVAGGGKRATGLTAKLCRRLLFNIKLQIAINVFVYWPGAKRTDSLVS